MADTRSEPSINKCSLCFVTLTCIVEEQFANSIMHDQNLTFKVFVLFYVHCTQSRHFGAVNMYLFSIFRFNFTDFQCVIEKLYRKNLHRNH